ncbi:NADH-quinone oxidoreductase subunit G [Ereboglobus sp. PH5-5]|uniref:2Fe-2S iron-sulfur cluster-binding protein n=1 Tax=Ereboglobus sp. PH5-5 TaxID=2940529 RepID=UPI002406CC65|nr:2Fe-2S iron-sulfur cluster-binding protein [Ereboglobus sp. PH5-5]MDF9833291.1 NADH-quinone oxidoreductase subunit G [Ereboglobus sp. PH5-5]
MSAPTATAATPDLVTVNIDGRDIAVPRGTNVVEAARLLGVNVPHYCYHPKLPVVGNCRMCLVEMGVPAVDRETRQPVIDPATGRQKINWMPKLQIGCGTNATPGLHIRTATPAVRQARESVTEFLLVNHPLDCPICDQAGECDLQEQAIAYGRGRSRYIEDKNVKPKHTQLGPRVMLDDERCILCSRCIRFTKEIAKDDVLGFIDRGSHSTLTCYPGKQLANNYSLNTVDICPVGALTSTDFRFKMRVWFLKQTNSIDTESSAGANTVVWSREGQIYRITPRRNDEVNDTWMPDSGRLLYKQVRAENRLTTETPLAELIAQAKSLLTGAVAPGSSGMGDSPMGSGGMADPAMRTGAAAPSTDESSVPHNPHGRVARATQSIALVASARSTMAEQYLCKKIADQLGIPAGSIHVPAHLGQGDGLLVSADRTPNTRGALLCGLATGLPKQQLTQLAADIDAGKIKTLLVINEDLAEAGITSEQLAKVSIIYLGTHANATSAAAKVVIPTQTVFEKDSSFVNQQFRLQRSKAAIPGHPGTHNDLVVLSHILVGLGGHDFAGSPIAAWSRLSEETPELAGLDYLTIPETGRVLDSTRFAHLAFPETEGLHYKPAAERQEESGARMQESEARP